MAALLRGLKSIPNISPLRSELLLARCFKSTRIEDLGKKRRIEFYQMPESFPCRTVEMVSATIGVELNKHYLNLAKGDQFQEAFLKINPRGKVPYIIDEDVRMGESRAIVAYLVDRYGEQDNTLYPRDPKKRAQINELMDLDLGTFYESVSRMYRPCIFGLSRKLNPEDEKNFLECFKYLNEIIKASGGKRFILGDELTLADICLASTLTFPYTFGYDLGTFSHIPGYFNRLQESITKFHEINDEPCKNLKEFARNRLD